MNYPRFIADRKVSKNFTVKEVAEMFDRHPKTVYRWINEGFLKNIIKVRDGYLIPETEINRIQIIINPES